MNAPVRTHHPYSVVQGSSYICVSVKNSNALFKKKSLWMGWRLGNLHKTSGPATPRNAQGETREKKPPTATKVLHSISTRVGENRHTQGHLTFPRPENERTRRAVCQGGSGWRKVGGAELCCGLNPRNRLARAPFRRKPPVWGDTRDRVGRRES